jgi:hypothetical protein
MAIPVLLYGFECWTSTKQQTNSTETAEGGGGNVTDKKRNENIRKDLHVTDVITRIQD